MMNKIVISLEAAISDINDGAVILLGGFGMSVPPHNLIGALLRRGTKDLTIIADDTLAFMELINEGRVRKIIAGFVGHPRPEMMEKFEKLYKAGKIVIEFVPHGTLVERVRSGGGGIAAFYTPTGVGTVVEAGKEKRIFNGREYVLEHALKGDFAFIKAYKADTTGNLMSKMNSGAYNLFMAMAARVTIAEVEEIVEAGQLDPALVQVPSIFVHRMIKAPKIVKWLQRGEI